MCFYTDYDWYAESYEDVATEGGRPERCDECGRSLTVWDWRRTIDMSEYEACQICGDQFSDDFIDEKEMNKELETGDAEYACDMLEILADHECDYGETCRYVRCLNCERLILAVEQAEKEAGCPEHAQRPGLFALYEDLDCHEDRDKYIKRAVEMYPELAGVRMIKEWIESEKETE